MKIERDVKPPVFDPITITIESFDELKWLLAVSNQSHEEAARSAREIVYHLPSCSEIQTRLYNGLEKYIQGNLK